MKKETISVKMAEDKLNALRQFTEDGMLSIEDELNDYAEKIYEKRVPKPVQKYIEGYAAMAQDDRPKKPRKPKQAQQETTLEQQAGGA